MITKYRTAQNIDYDTYGAAKKDTQCKLALL
jgi:hypothetical protein